MMHASFRGRRVAGLLEGSLDKFTAAIVRSVRFFLKEKSSHGVMFITRWTHAQELICIKKMFQDFS